MYIATTSELLEGTKRKALNFFLLKSNQNCKSIRKNTENSKPY